MSDNPAKHEVLIKQYLGSILDISVALGTWLESGPPVKWLTLDWDAVFFSEHFYRL